MIGLSWWQREPLRPGQVRSGQVRSVQFSYLQLNHQFHPSTSQPKPTAAKWRAGIQQRARCSYRRSFSFILNVVACTCTCVRRDASGEKPDEVKAQLWICSVVRNNNPPATDLKYTVLRKSALTLKKAHHYLALKFKPPFSSR